MASWLVMAFCLGWTALSGVSALDNGLGLVPPMGYSSADIRAVWDTIDEKTIKDTADTLVSTGLAHAGYRYVIVDITWAKQKDSEGVLQPSSRAFPSGMAALGQYIHSKGLLFGLEVMDHDSGPWKGLGDDKEVNAKAFAAWGVDYVRDVFMTGSREVAYSLLTKTGDCLNATGRPMFLAAGGSNEWYAPMGYGLANSWEVSGHPATWYSLMQGAMVSERLARYAGPGGWNTPGYLLGSYQKVTPVQQRTVLNLWAIIAAPLVMSFDIRNISKQTLETYSNRDVIAISQDKAGRQGMLLAGGDRPRAGGEPAALPSKQSIWGRQLSDGSWALLFVNEGSDNADMTCDAKCFEPTGFNAYTTFTVRNLWTHEDEGKGKGDKFTVYSVSGNGGSVMLKLKFKPEKLE